MLDSLFVHNFRLFKKLEIERLSRVNLIVGKNNSGKSCLLETLYLYKSTALSLPHVLWELLSQRNELWEQDREDGDIIYKFEHPFRYLFYGYHLPDSYENQIEIGSLKDEGLYNLYISVIIESNNINLNLKKGGINIYYSLKESESIVQMARRIRRSLLNTKENIQIVSARGMSEEKVSLLWDKVNLTDTQDEIIDGLKLINSTIKGIALVGAQDSDKYRIPIVRLEQSSERFPLKSMGDGMTRLFHLILALANAKDGTLLVDEFENGLHWSVLPKVWDTIFRLSERLNVQVFATTHSRDCVLGFEKAWKKDESLASFHRLDADPEYGAKSMSYSLETLSDALDMDVEVR